MKFDMTSSFPKRRNFKSLGAKAKELETPAKSSSGPLSPPMTSIARVMRASVELMPKRGTEY